MPTAREIGLLAAAYALGCIVAGYYLVRWRRGEDLRTLGTGTAGARNAGRVLGPAGFVATALLDAAKGVAAVAGARWLGASEPWVAAAMLAVVAGHVWPAHLRFRGGKGVSTAVGALVAFEPWTAAALVVGFVPVRLALRRTTPAGLAAFAIAPVLLWASSRTGPGATAAVAAVAALVLFAHRANLREEFARRATPPSRAQ